MQENLSREKVLDWINDLLKTKLRKIEDLATGQHYCQMLDAALGGQLCLRGVHWEPKQDWQSNQNLKFLARSFRKYDISKNFSIQRLSAKIFKEHFQMALWMIGLVQQRNYQWKSYKAETRRQQSLLDPNIGRASRKRPTTLDTRGSRARSQKVATQDPLSRSVGKLSKFSSSQGPSPIQRRKTSPAVSVPPNSIPSSVPSSEVEDQKKSAPRKSMIAFNGKSSLALKKNSTLKPKSQPQPAPYPPMERIKPIVKFNSPILEHVIKICKIEDLCEQERIDRIRSFLEMPSERDPHPLPICHRKVPEGTEVGIQTPNQTPIRALYPFLQEDKKEQERKQLEKKEQEKKAL